MSVTVLAGNQFEANFCFHIAHFYHRPDDVHLCLLETQCR